MRYKPEKGQLSGDTWEEEKRKAISWQHKPQIRLLDSLGIEACGRSFTNYIFWPWTTRELGCCPLQDSLQQKSVFHWMAKVTLLEKLGQLLMLQVVEDLIHGLNLKTSISNCQLKILKLRKLSFFRWFFCAPTSLCLNRHFRPNSLVITRREKQDDNLGVTICKYLTTDKWPKAKTF